MLTPRCTRPWIWALALITLALLVAAGFFLSQPGPSPASSGSDSPTSQPSLSEAASTQAAAQDSEAAADSELEERGEAAAVLASAAPLASDSQEVVRTQQLYQQVQEVYSQLDPLTQLDNPQDEDNELVEEIAPEVTPDENASPKSYVSEQTLKKLETLATGAALDEYISTATEYALGGWKTQGKVEVVGQPRLAEGSYEGKPAQLLEVCLDSSKLTLQDQAGNSYSSDPARSLNIFTLIEVDGSWKIASHDYPNNPDC